MQVVFYSSFSIYREEYELERKRGTGFLARELGLGRAKPRNYSQAINEIGIMGACQLYLAIRSQPAPVTQTGARSRQVSGFPHRLSFGWVFADSFERYRLEKRHAISTDFSCHKLSNSPELHQLEHRHATEHEHAITNKNHE